MQGAGELIALGDDFEMIESSIEYGSGDAEDYQRTCGKINAATATALKLSNHFLADRMRVSYINEGLKNKYRK